MHIPNFIVPLAWGAYFNTQYSLMFLQAPWSANREVCYFFFQVTVCFIWFPINGDMTLFLHISAQVCQIDFHWQRTIEITPIIPRCFYNFIKHILCFHCLDWETAGSTNCAFKSTLNFKLSYLFSFFFPQRLAIRTI